jgi:hypothetical protein
MILNHRENGEGKFVVFGFCIVSIYNIKILNVISLNSTTILTGMTMDI